jgi:hypothetical protein
MLRLALAMLALAHVGVVAADEAPIAGTVKSIDAVAKTLTVEALAQGRSRVVVIEVRPGSRIVRTRRSSDPARPGFVEQAIGLDDIRPGWTVSVKTKHEGDREVAEVVKVLMERAAP